jgi:hypothetical protein
VSKLAIQIASRKKGEMKDVEMYRDLALKECADSALGIVSGLPSFLFLFSMG